MNQKVSKENFLSELGLSKNDSKVYVTLVREGSISITEIARKSSIHRANVYESLERLKFRSLVSETSLNGKKVIQAAEPSALQNLLYEKELKLKAMLPQFMLDYDLAQKKNIFEAYEGVQAIRNLFKHYLEIGEDIYSIGVPNVAIPLIGEYFQNVIHKQRAKKKQWMHHIYNNNAKDRAKFLNTLPYTTARCLPQEYDFPVVTRVCGSEVSFTIYSDNPLTYIIRSSEMAEVYRKYFAILWDRALEV